MKYTLPITDTYVRDWDDWCAVRELLQNAMDAADAGGERPSMTYADGKLVIASPMERLPRKSLLLGCTTKSDERGQRGKFGEGYKLALLVFCRRNLSVRIHNGGEVWEPSFEKHPDFDNEPVLTISVRPAINGDFYDGVKFVVDGFPPESWEIVKARWIPDVNVDAIMKNGEAGNIYSGGLFIAKNLKLHRGYNFAPHRLKLNRDRNMACDFDIKWHTSDLWTKRARLRPNEFLALHKANAADVEYAEFVPATTAMSVLREYEKEYGEGTVPVETQAELDRVRAQGFRAQIVPRTLRKVLTGVKKFVSYQMCSTPGGKVKAFFDKYKDRLDLDIREELEILVAESVNWR